MRTDPEILFWYAIFQDMQLLENFFFDTIHVWSFLVDWNFLNIDDLNISTKNLFYTMYDMRITIGQLYIIGGRCCKTSTNLKRRARVALEIAPPVLKNKITPLLPKRRSSKWESLGRNTYRLRRCEDCLVRSCKLSFWLLVDDIRTRQSQTCKASLEWNITPYVFYPTFSATAKFIFMSFQAHELFKYVISTTDYLKISMFSRLIGFR